MNGPFTPELRHWLLLGLLNSFGIEPTEDEMAQPTMAFQVDDCRLLVGGDAAGPLLFVEYRGDSIGFIAFKDDTDIELSLGLCIREPGNFPNPKDLARPLRLIFRLLRAGRGLLQERTAG